MSLYSQLFGVNHDFPALLGMIKFTLSDFERFRDIYLCDGGENIIVYTRLGGGNRKDYQQVYEKVKKSPLYLTDYDDEMDNTYSYIKFRVPEDYLYITKKIFKEEPMSIGDKFQKEFKEMEDPNSEAHKRMLAIAESLDKIISDSENNGGIFLI